VLAVLERLSNDRSRTTTFTPITRQLVPAPGADEFAAERDRRDVTNR
jgi:hypothetical protein